MNRPGSSPARIAANRANATRSTGPKTEGGKRISSHNALKTGLTGRTVLLPTDDVVLYQEHLARIADRHQPATDEERGSTQAIAQLEWRLLRIPTLETGIYALGRKLLAAGFADEPAETRGALLEAQVFITYQKQLTNLYLQETRLTRQLEREIAKLDALQSERKALDQRKMDEAAAYYANCVARSTPYQHADVTAAGFEFSVSQVQRAAGRLRGRQERPAWPTIHAEHLYQAMPKPDAA